MVWDLINTAIYNYTHTGNKDLWGEKMLVEIVKNEIKKRLANEISRYSRDQILDWLKGSYLLTDILIRQNGALILSHRGLAMDVMRCMTIDEIRQILLLRRPSENDIWKHPVFDNKMTEEFRNIVNYISR